MVTIPDNYLEQTNLENQNHISLGILALYSTGLKQSDLSMICAIHNIKQLNKVIGIRKLIVKLRAIKTMYPEIKTNQGDLFYKEIPNLVKLGYLKKESINNKSYDYSIDYSKLGSTFHIPINITNEKKRYAISWDADSLINIITTYLLTLGRYDLFKDDSNLEEGDETDYSKFVHNFKEFINKLKECANNSCFIIK